MSFELYLLWIFREIGALFRFQGVVFLDSNLINFILQPTATLNAGITGMRTAYGAAAAATVPQPSLANYAVAAG